MYHVYSHTHDIHVRAPILSYLDGSHHRLRIEKAKQDHYYTIVSIKDAESGTSIVQCIASFHGPARLIYVAAEGHHSHGHLHHAY